MDEITYQSSMDFCLHSYNLLVASKEQKCEIDIHITDDENRIVFSVPREICRFIKDWLKHA